MEIKSNVSLKPFNTFSIEVKSNQFVEVNTLAQLKEVVSKNNLPVLILGGGSNLLFTKDFEGLVIKNNLRGIELVKENDDEVVLKVGAGEIWHDFVLHCIEKKYAGIENLSLIPGSVGASPMQNIGAYGTEVKDCIVEVEAFHMDKQELKTFSNSDCSFGYRTSIFKTTEKGNYFITAVTYRLSKTPSINTSYGAIEQQLEQMEIISPSIKEVSDAIITIRNSKLPNPKEIGNAGSFFKNPVVGEALKNKLMTQYPEMPNYPQTNGKFKLAAGWLIEKSGWKGKKYTNYGVHDRQALVLVNYGGAEGKEIYQLSEDIIYSVKQNFEITLEREVNII